MINAKTEMKCLLSDICFPCKEDGSLQRLYVVQLDRNAVDLAATEIRALIVRGWRAGITMMMSSQRRWRGMIARLTNTVVVVMRRGADMDQRPGKRFHRTKR